MVINQAYLFLIFIIDGLLIGILFDVFRILRKSFKTSNILTYIEDLIFWILTGLILLYTIFIFNNGEMRFYMFLGVFIGCIIYMLIFSKNFITINVKIITKIKNIIKKFLSLITFPIKMLINVIFFRKQEGKIEKK